MHNDPKEGNGKQQPETNNPDKVINSPEEVQESNDEKIDEDFPGYPHYPAKDDILNPGNDIERVDLDVEDLSRSKNITSSIRFARKNTDNDPDFTEIKNDEPDDLGIVENSDTDVNAEDLAILGPRDGDMDMDEDEELRLKGYEPRTGKDLDVPEAEMEDDVMPGMEDEENSYYSLGGDEKGNLEENKE